MGCSGWTRMCMRGYMHLCGAITTIKHVIVKFLMSQQHHVVDIKEGGGCEHHLILYCCLILTII